MTAAGNGTHVPGADALGLLPQVPHLDNTFGAVLIGTFIGLMCVSSASPGDPPLVLMYHSLYGITLHQSYRYFRMYPADLPILKFLVRSVHNHAMPSADDSTFTGIICFVHLCFHPQPHPLTRLQGIGDIHICAEHARLVRIQPPFTQQLAHIAVDALATTILYPTTSTHWL